MPDSMTLLTTLSTRGTFTVDIPDGVHIVYISHLRCGPYGLACNTPAGSIIENIICTNIVDSTSTTIGGCNANSANYICKLSGEAGKLTLYANNNSSAIKYGHVNPVLTRIFIG